MEIRFIKNDLNPISEVNFESNFIKIRGMLIAEQNGVTIMAATGAAVYDIEKWPKPLRHYNKAQMSWFEADGIRFYTAIKSLELSAEKEGIAVSRSVRGNIVSIKPLRIKWGWWMEFEAAFQGGMQDVAILHDKELIYNGIVKANMGDLWLEGTGFVVLRRDKAIYKELEELLEGKELCMWDPRLYLVCVSGAFYGRSFLIDENITLQGELICLK